MPQDRANNFGEGSSKKIPSKPTKSMSSIFHEAYQACSKGKQMATHNQLIEYTKKKYNVDLEENIAGIHCVTRSSREIPFIECVMEKSDTMSASKRALLEERNKASTERAVTRQMSRAAKDMEEKLKQSKPEIPLSKGSSKRNA